jgi:hypothetical protein
MARPVTFPDRPLLLPGVLVTRRGGRHLQIGLDPALAVVTPDVPAARELLRSLGEGLAPEVTPAVARLSADLLDRGLVIDGDDLFVDLPASRSGAQAVSAVYAHADLDAHTLLARRSTRPVVVETAEPLVESGDLARRLLRLSGVPTDGSPYAVLLVAVREFDRTRVDELFRSDTPHLLVQVVEGVVRLGPFVVPGVTACLRCVDAHLGDADPRRALVVEQYARAAVHRADGVPEPVDPAVVTSAIGWAARDLVSFVDDEVPATWSAGVRFGPGMQQERTEWPRHQRCGCAWADATAGG